MSLAFVFISVSLAALAQVCMKMGMISPAVKSAIQTGDWREATLTIATSPLVVVGLGCFVLSAALWLLVLARIPLSSAYPFMALGIIATVMAGRLVFGEPISYLTIAGVSLIGLGIMAVAAGAQSSP